MDLRLENQPKAVFALQVFVTRIGNPERRIVLERTYSHEFALADRNPETLTNGLSQALQLCLADLERDLRALDIKP